MLRLFYNRNHTFNKLFWFFWNYFQDAPVPTAENLFLLAISMLALESFRSIRFAWLHIISKLTGKSLNSFYYTLGYAAFDHLKWMAVTANTDHRNHKKRLTAEKGFPGAYAQVRLSVKSCKVL